MSERTLLCKRPLGLMLESNWVKKVVKGKTQLVREEATGGKKRPRKRFRNIDPCPRKHGRGDHAGCLDLLGNNKKGKTPGESEKGGKKNRKSGEKRDRRRGVEEKRLPGVRNDLLGRLNQERHDVWATAS